MQKLDKALVRPLTELLLSLADDTFMLGHRNADWTGLAPILEEDIAFSSLAQDDLAHAAALYEFIAGLDEQAGAGSAAAPGDSAARANHLAYGRTPDEYRCAAIVELHDEFDWGVAIARQFFCDHFDHLRLQRLAGSAFPPLRQLAVRLLAEERLAIGHADQWIVRLGRGTAESRGRIQTAIDRLAPLAVELFEPTPGVERLEAAGVYPRLDVDMFDAWSEAVENVMEEATLHATLTRLPAGFVGGRQGRHSDEFAALLDELTEVYRVEPEAAW